MVMDWRWKSLANKIDPAQLRASVVEYLLPKMDTGLLYADITENMCRAWLSTIIYTICAWGNMAGAHSINKSGFCILSGIPDIWMRTQISRATDLLVNLNSFHGDHGRSTRARLFSLTKATDIKSASIFLQTKVLKRKKFFRTIPTLQFLKRLGMNIADAPANNDAPLNLIAEPYCV